MSETSCIFHYIDSPEECIGHAGFVLLNLGGPWQHLREIARVMKEGSRLVVGFEPRDNGQPLRIILQRFLASVQVKKYLLFSKKLALRESA